MKTLLLVLGIVCCAPAFSQEKLKKGQVFPSMELKALRNDKKGNPLKLAQKKKATVVDFWASWCGPCKLSMPFLNQLHEDYREKGLLVLGINVDEEIEKGIKFADEFKLKFSVLRDTEKALIDKVGVSAMPTSFLLDSSGKIVYVHQGFREGDDKKMLEQIRKVLK